MHKYDEVCNFAPARIAECQGVLGNEHEHTLFLRVIYARAIFASPRRCGRGRFQAETILVDVSRIARRVLGPSHPRTTAAEHELRVVRGAPGVRSLFDP